MEIKSIASALIKAQLELKNLDKKKEGYGYKYVELSAILDDVKPILAKHGLAVTQLATDDGNGRVGVKTLLMHESGEFLESNLTLPIPTMKNANATQAAGAAITYARRYALSAILNISSDEDTDAAGVDTKNGAVSNTASNQPHNTPAKPQGQIYCGTHPKAVMSFNKNGNPYHRNQQGEFCNGRGFPGEIQKSYPETIQ